MGLLCMRLLQSGQAHKSEPLRRRVSAESRGHARAALNTLGDFPRKAGKQRAAGRLKWHFCLWRLRDVRAVSMFGPALPAVNIADQPGFLNVDSRRMQQLTEALEHK